MKPMIGILGNTFMTEPGSFVSAEKEYVNMGYIKGINRNGGIAVILPTDTLLTDASSAMGMLDGLLIPGGEDVDPDYYGEEPLPKCGEIRPEIDEAWKNAYTYARAHELPILGICKGIQFINVMEGGTLYQDLDYIPGEHLKHQQRYSRTYLTHYVEIEKDSRLFQMIGRPEIRTNTMYHQAVKDPGRGLRVVARAKDGVVEAIEDEDSLIEAVQWHPESLLDSNPVMNELFRDLVRRAGNH